MINFFFAGGVSIIFLYSSVPVSWGSPVRLFLGGVFKIISSSILVFSFLDFLTFFEDSAFSSSNEIFGFSQFHVLLFVDLKKNVFETKKYLINFTRNKSKQMVSPLFRSFLLSPPPNESSCFPRKIWLVPLFS